MLVEDIQQFLQKIQNYHCSYFKEIDFGEDKLYTIQEDELLHLSQEYELDLSYDELIFTLKDVYLFYEGMNYLLGDYTFYFNSCGELQCKYFHPEYSVLNRKDKYKHLYINGSSCCLGMFKPSIEKNLFLGNLKEVFTLLRIWLSYDGESGYIKAPNFLYAGCCPICNRKLSEYGECPNNCKYDASSIDLDSLNLRYCHQCDEELDEDGDCPYCSRCSQCGELLNDDGYCESCKFCGNCGESLNDDGYCYDCDYCKECHELHDDCKCDDEEIEEDSSEKENNEFLIDYGKDDRSQLPLPFDRNQLYSLNEEIKLTLTL